MSVLSPKRAILFVVVLLFAVPLLASHPSPRFQPRMAFDERAGVGVLFGGRGIGQNAAELDPATGLVHASDETWVWIRDQWVQQFPAVRPAARSAHSMVYDSKRNRVILFGGRKEATAVREMFTVLNDTWVWQNGTWTEIDTATDPPARHFAGMAYDRDRDRVVLFGGYDLDAAKKFRPMFDTWEFDGEKWIEVSKTGPSSAEKPMLAYDAARRETIMVAFGTNFQTQTHRWDAAAATWRNASPSTTPTCLHEGSLVYQAHNQRVVAAGGLCALDTTSVADETWEWDGTNWTKLETNSTLRVSGAAAAYDTVYQRVVRYGGVSSFGTLGESATYTFRDGRWEFRLPISASPEPRSLPAFRRDPVNNTIWLHGGLSEYSTGTSIGYITDHWRYNGGRWNQITAPGLPTECTTPMAAFDTNRNVMVLVCAGTEVHEWDGVAWKSVSSEKRPVGRRFSAFVYDETIKKAVLFGGFDGVNYKDDTWTWDGTAWTEVKPKTKPPHRGQMLMWYDPLARKTILYTGVGRRNLDERVTRYSDMWSFDGTTWTNMNITQTPGIRFGAQYAIDPRDGRLLVFGGLRATIDEKKNVSQFYDNDLWVWDGSANRWTQLTPQGAPPPRQNGAFDFDAETGRFVLFGGYAGNLYLSDTWLWDGEKWTPLPNAPVAHRRRPTRS